MRGEPASFVLAMGQMLVEGGLVDRNLSRAAETIREAATRGCDIVLLPECLDAGWTHPSAREIAAPIPGASFDRLAEAAAKNGVWVVAGLTELAEDGRVFNAAALIDSTGKLRLKHRKINILDIAQDLYSTGDGLGVAETEFGAIGITICADNYPTNLALAHSVARMGAHFILAPNAWAVPPGYDNETKPYGGKWVEAYSTLGKLYDICTVGVSNVGRVNGGPWKGWSCIGCSLAVGAGGKILKKLPFGEDAEVLELLEIAPVVRPVRGTLLLKELESRGYAGP